MNTINFGDPDDANPGFIQYDHGNNKLIFGGAARTVAHYNSDGNYEQGLSGGGDGIFLQSPGPGSSGAYITLVGFEDKGAFHYIYQDQGDDNNDKWANFFGDVTNGGSHSGLNLRWAHYASGSWDVEMQISQGGVLTTEGAQNASTTIDYAEFFEWKTELASDAKITETYGMTVVLDNGKVRLAEAGEEAKVIGVVRPNNTSAMVGGSQALNWQGKFERNIWGEYVEEDYTQIGWLTDGKWETYAKDTVPSDVTIPSTDEEKTAKTYTEKTAQRRKLNSSYDASKTYVSREERRKEWCVVGLLGQVEIRDTAVIPTTWTKMKNVGTGVDLYFIK
jgi:hypothetical protein